MSMSMVFDNQNNSLLSGSPGRLTEGGNFDNIGRVGMSTLSTIYPKRGGSV